MARLQEQFKKEFHSELKDELGIANVMAVPKLSKVVISMGTGSPTLDRNRAGEAAKDLATITGQKPDMRRARKSVSNFKVREGYDVGCRVTLRGRRMYEFVDRLINAAIPRRRDFRGLNPRSFDGRGNYSMGVMDQSIFPEIDAGNVTRANGMNVTFVTTARNDKEGRALLTKLGMPFRKPKE